MTRFSLTSQILGFPPHCASTCMHAIYRTCTHNETKGNVAWKSAIALWASQIQGLISENVLWKRMEQLPGLWAPYPPLSYKIRPKKQNVDSPSLPQCGYCDGLLSWPLCYRFGFFNLCLDSFLCSDIKDGMCQLFASKVEEGFNSDPAGSCKTTLWIVWASLKGSLRRWLLPPTDQTGNPPVLFFSAKPLDNFCSNWYWAV